MAESKRDTRKAKSATRGRPKAAARTNDKAARTGGAKRKAATGGGKAGTGSREKAAARSGGSKTTRDGNGAKRASDARASAGKRSSAQRSSGGGTRNGSRGSLSAIEAVRSARRSLAELLGRPVEGVLGVDRDHGNWIVTAQVVELERVPNTMDVLGDYEAVLDKNGEVVGYHRTHRYRRGQVDEGQ